MIRTSNPSVNSRAHLPNMLYLQYPKWANEHSSLLMMLQASIKIIQVLESQEYLILISSSYLNIMDENERDWLCENMYESWLLGYLVQHNNENDRRMLFCLE